MAKILVRIGQLFSTSKLGIIVSILFSKATSSIVREILDKDNQRVAYEFVKSLKDRNDIDNAEKARIFNKKMLEWTGLMGRKMCGSVVNCLRELAVNALKAEQEGE